MGSQPMSKDEVVEHAARSVMTGCGISNVAPGNVDPGFYEELKNRVNRLYDSHGN